MRDGVITLTHVTDHRYHYRDQTGRRTVKLDARLDGPQWGAYDCFSDVVSFSAAGD